MKPKKIIVIGGGIGGLATAALLARQGHDVTVVEKNRAPGGRASVFEKEGYRFDMGPSWYLMPDVFEHFFGLFGKQPSDYYTLEKLTPSYRIFFQDGETIDVSTDVNALGDLFESWEPGAKEKFKDFLEKSGYAYKIAMEDFVYKNYNSILDFFNWKMLTQGTKLNVFSDMQSYVEKYFKDPRIQKVLQYTLVFLGGSPSNTPALYNIMSHVDFKMGVWYPDGGIYSLITGLVKLCEEMGVTILTDTPVDHIEVHKGKAVGVHTNAGFMTADEVVSNADYHFTEEKLLDEEYRSYSKAFWKKRVQAPSAFIMYLGIDKSLPMLKHHTLMFAKDWEEHFGQIFDHPMWPDNPSFYLCNPSKTDSTVAPEGKENVFLLAPVASGLVDNEETRQKVRDHMLTLIESYIGTDIRSHIEVERIFSINDFKQDYNSHKGSALGLAHTLFQTALFRPNNKSKKVSNLYYVGANTVPGIGMPMCLISAQLTCDRITSS